MENVLIVSGTEKAGSLICELLREQGPIHAAYAANGGEARRRIAEGDYAVIAINAPLRDESGEELAVMAAESTDAGILLLASSQVADAIAEKVEESGVFVMAKPITRQLLYQSLRLAAATSRRMQLLRRENSKLMKKIEDIRLVDRAKCILIEHLRFTEPQAHRHIEQQAMDRRITRREVAEQILNTYEN